VGAVLWAFLAFSGGSDDEGMPIEDAEGTTSSTTQDEDEGERGTTATRRGPTTTTMQVIPGAPLLGEPTGLALVVLGSSGRLIDLDTGGVTRLPEQVLGVTTGGLLVRDADGLATWPPPYDGSSPTTVLPTAPGTVIEQVWVVGGGTLVWVMDRPEHLSAIGPAWSLSLVDLEGGPPGRFELPAEVWPVGATDHGLVVSGPGGVYLVGSGGDAERVSTGDPIGVVGDQIHVVNCDEDLRCHIEVFDGRGRLIDEQPSPAGPVGWGWGTAAPDGRIAEVVLVDPLGERTEVTIDGVTVYEESGTLPGAGPGGLAWSPDGRWLAIAALDGIHVLDTLGDGGERLIHPGLVRDAGSLFFAQPTG
jgi:hypothetical protein